MIEHVVCFELRETAAVCEPAREGAHVKMERVTGVELSSRAITGHLMTVSANHIYAFSAVSFSSHSRLTAKDFSFETLISIRRLIAIAWIVAGECG